MESAQVESETLPTLTRAEQVRELVPARAALGYPVHLVGVVTFSDPRKGLLFVQDGSESVFVAPQAQTWDWPVAQKVEINGVTARGSHLAYVNQAQLLDLGPGTLPRARPVTFARLASNAEDGSWVEIRGVVRTSGVKRGQPVLEIAAEGKRIRALFTDIPTVRDELSALVDAEVRLQGVSGLADKDPDSLFFMDLHVPSLANLVVEVPAPAQPLLAPARPIASLSIPPLTQGLVHRLRVKGKMDKSPDGTWRITDETGSIRAYSTQPLVVWTNSAADVLGFPGSLSTTFVLEDATMFLPGRPQSSSSPASAAPEALLPVLTQAEAVRNLAVSEVQRGYPVRIQGVITYSDPDWGLLFIQDDTSGVAVADPAHLFAGKAGQAAAVEGYSGMGPYAPILRQPRFRLLGPGRLPMAKPLTLEQLRTGQEDSQRVEVQGIVRHLAVESGHLALTFSTSGGVLKAFVPDFGTNPIPAHLVDAEVWARGVCEAIVNQDRQQVGVRLLTVGLADIRVSKPAPANPFDLPVQPISQLFQFQSQSDLRHRIHVRGSVTFRDPQWCTLFVQDENSSLYICTLTTPTLALGDQVDVVGFVGLESYGPAMSEAVFRRLGPGPPPSPTTITIDQAISGAYQSRLITLEARLVDRIRGAAGRGLILQGAEWGFTALLESTQDARSLASLREGSLLRLTGICRLEGSDSQAGKALRLQLRTPDDVVVLKQPPRWTARHWMTAAGLSGSLFAAAVTWVILLRRNVREQTEVIRRKMEREAALERRYSELVQHANSIILRWSRDGRILFLNEFGQRFFGYTEAEVCGRHVVGTIVPETDSAGRNLSSFIEQLCGNPAAFEQNVNENVRRNGERVWISWTNKVVLDTQDRVVEILSIGTDITARKRAQDALRQSEQQFRLIMENLADLVAVLDLDGGRLYSSPSYQSILGDPQKLQGSSSFQEVHPEDRARVRRAFEETVQTGVGQRLDYRFVDRNGSIRHIESQGSAICDAQGKVSQVLVVSRDVTERRQAEDAIRELNASLEERVLVRTTELAEARDRAEAADRVKSAFLATMSHELRTPLNSIIGFTGILLQRLAGPLNAEQVKQLEMVRTSARHLLMLINDVLDISKIEAGQLQVTHEAFDVRASIAKVVGLVTPLADKKGLALQVRLSADLGKIVGDPRRIEQILLNLLNNAVKFTEQGHVMLTVEFVAPQSAIRNPQSAIERSSIRFSVEDTGIGIKPADLATLFQPFRQVDSGLTRNHDGTGLGLAICRRLADLLGGEILAESEWGKGSTFTLTLPGKRGNA